MYVISKNYRKWMKNAEKELAIHNIQKIHEKLNETII